MLWPKGDTFHSLHTLVADAVAIYLIIGGYPGGKDTDVCGEAKVGSGAGGMDIGETEDTAALSRALRKDATYLGSWARRSSAQVSFGPSESTAKTRLSPFLFLDKSGAPAATGFVVLMVIDKGVAETLEEGASVTESGCTVSLVRPKVEEDMTLDWEVERLDATGKSEDIAFGCGMRMSCDGCGGGAK